MFNIIAEYFVNLVTSLYQTIAIVIENYEMPTGRKRETIKMHLDDLTLKEMSIA